MEISRFRNSNGSGHGVDRNTWDNWLSDDIVPASKSAALSPKKPVQATPTLKAVPATQQLKAAPKTRASEPVVTKKRPTYAARRPATATGRPNAYYAMGGSVTDVAYGRAKLPNTAFNKHKSNISISIRFPKIRLPKIKKMHVSETARPWVIAGAVVAALLVSGSIYSFVQNSRVPEQQVATISATKDMGYKPFAPEGKTVEQAGQYDAERKMYTFHDTYGGINITVNQQTLPEGLQDNAAERQKIADSIFATETFQTAKGTAYMATSEGSGAQRVALIGDNLLMFLQSTKRLDSAGWILYIQTLK